MRRVGFIGTRFAGTDGVSLETEKCAAVLARLGFESVYFSGYSDKPPEISYVADKAFFGHPEADRLQRQCFGSGEKPVGLEEDIRKLTDELKEELYRFIRQFTPEFVIIENALAIPMHIPLGLAVTEVLEETGITAIAHHADFSWERERFSVTCVPHLLDRAFPPVLDTLFHAVINSEARSQLYRRKSVTAPIIPNVYDFANPPGGIDSWNRDLRSSFGLKEGELLFLQPTRIVPRKGIEHAIELIRRLDGYSVRLVIPHHELDEGDAYVKQLMKQAERSGVSMECCPDHIGLTRGYASDGSKRYSLWDLYIHADFVTYPSLYEGFGNAFLEAVYFRKPIFVNRYTVYRDDIEPCGFRTVTIDGEVTDEAVRRVKELLADREKQRQYGEINYELGRTYFSFETLETVFAQILAECGIRTDRTGKRP